MTKFDVYVDGLSAKRQARNNDRYNARLAWSLQQRAYGDVVAEMLQSLSAFGAKRRSVAGKAEKREIGMLF